MQEQQGFPTVPGYYVLRAPLSQHISYVYVDVVENGNTKEFFFNYLKSNLKYFFSDYKVCNDYEYYYWAGPIEIAGDLINIAKIISKCPSCYSEYPNINMKKLKLSTLIGNTEKTYYQCQCNDCYFSSSIKETEKEATEEWNRLYLKLTEKD